MEFNKEQLKKSAEELGLKIEFDSDNPGIHSVDEEGNIYTTTFDMITDSFNDIFTKSYKNSLYYKISYLIWLIKQVDGGKSYLKRIYKLDEYEDLSECIDDDKDLECNECGYWWDDEYYNSTNCPSCGQELL